MKALLKCRSLHWIILLFLGRIAVGKVARGTIKEDQQIALVQADGGIKKMKVKELYTFEGTG